MKVYTGDRTIDGIVVTVNGKDLEDHSKITKFTSGGFEWGFEAPPATQLAFAMLYDHTGDAKRSKELAKPFMKLITANFANEWEMTSADIDTAIEQL
ncbi:DUF6166 domain-containing protein [Pontibaca salina]|uniref:Uncharacterized protein n=1 Tax=Pontibaca salina TaxID=2795731 RepID=A0A934M1B7_9RHOB|nr:hypothetical protein [Pontibaca salina]